MSRPSSMGREGAAGVFDLGLFADLGDGFGRDARGAALRAAPVAAVAVTDVAADAQGMTLQDWVFVLTLVYLLLQIVYLGWKFIGDVIRSRKARRVHRRTAQDE